MKLRVPMRLTPILLSSILSANLINIPINHNKKIEHDDTKINSIESNDKYLKYYITALENINIYEEKNTKSNKIGIIPKDEIIELINKLDIVSNF